MKKMNCKRVNGQLLAYLDGEGSLQERKRIQDHLSTCPRCQHELTAIAATRNRLRQGLAAEVEGLSVSPEAWEKLRKKLEPASKETVWRLILGKLRIRVREASLFLSGQPAWKKVLGAALVLVVAIGLVFGVSELFQYKALALTEGIIENDPQIQATYGKEMKVVDIKRIDGRATAVCTRQGANSFVLVEVNLRAKKVLRVQPIKVTVENVGDGKLVVLPKGGNLVALRVEVGNKDWVVNVPVEGTGTQDRITLKGGSSVLTAPSLSSGKVAWIIESAKADPRVKRLLEEGGRITGVTETHSIRRREGSAPEPEINLFTLTGAQVMIEQAGKHWNVEVTPEGRVSGITEAK